MTVWLSGLMITSPVWTELKIVLRYCSLFLSFFGPFTIGDILKDFKCTYHPAIYVFYGDGREMEPCAGSPGLREKICCLKCPFNIW